VGILNAAGNDTQANTVPGRKEINISIANSAVTPRCLVQGWEIKELTAHVLLLGLHFVDLLRTNTCIILKSFLLYYLLSPDGRRPLGRPRRRREDNIKMDLQAVGWGTD
jgi:hypothetical protein